jgi:hypothetical protein
MLDLWKQLSNTFDSMIFKPFYFLLKLIYAAEPVFVNAVTTFPVP